MTVLEAYREALKRPIEELPNIYLQCELLGRRFFLREDAINGCVCLVDEDCATDDFSVTLETNELMSNVWEVKLDRSHSVAL